MQDGPKAPLVLAVNELDVAKVKELLASGADPNATDEGRSILAIAAFEDSGRAIQIMELLVAAGADVNFLTLAKDGKAVSTPLISAAKVGNAAAVRFLVQSGADLDLRFIFGTALTQAAIKGFDDIALLLLEAGADPTLGLPNEPDSTPAKEAKASGHWKLAAALEASEAAWRRGRVIPRDDDGPEKFVTTINEAVKALETKLSEHLPDVLGTLRRPATSDEIASTERIIGIALPDGLLRWLRKHDGQTAQKESKFIKTGGTFDDPFRFLSAEEIGREWKIWSDLLNGGEFDQSRSTPSGGVSADWFNPKWIPITTNGCGDSHCLDLSPAPAGMVGQVIVLWHDSSRRPLVADSLAEWFVQLALAI